jgi:hypothetical protein
MVTKWVVEYDPGDLSLFNKLIGLSETEGAFREHWKRDNGFFRKLTDPGFVPHKDEITKDGKFRTTWPKKHYKYGRENPVSVVVIHLRKVVGEVYKQLGKPAPEGFKLWVQVKDDTYED